MTQLYYSNATPWSGERINGVLYPASIAWLWSDAELAAIGLYRPQQPVTIPEGKRVSASVELVEGVVRFALEDIQPVPRRRVEKWLIIQRIAEAGKSELAYELLTAPGNRAAFIEWNAPVESVFHDDVKTVYFIEALGLNAVEVMRE